MLDLRSHQNNSLNALTAAVRGIINLPTGTGKTLIQSRAIANEILAGSTKVYVILSPRILLSNQLMNDVRKDLAENGTEAQYLIVHSSFYDAADNVELEASLGVLSHDTLMGTTHETIRTARDKAEATNVPLVISGTYHSAKRIRSAGIEVEIVFCDEAHYLVQEQFSCLVTQPFANRAFFFTATLRETPSAEGMGMNNTELFGEVIYQEKPAALIAAGEMVRPRMHMVDMSHDPQKDEGDGLAVAEAFEQHRGEVKTGAKLLVVSKDGSKHLNNLATHPEILLLAETRPALRIFDISSAHKARIDGVVVTRDVFLSELRNMKDSDEAIIIHHDILAEGIDVPGITGVMPLISLKKAKFLQTLGRATRLHSDDRRRLYAEELMANELRRFVKPYAWLIIPVYGEIGEDLRADMKEMVRELRDHGFNPSEDIVVRQQRGKKELTPITMVNEVTRSMTELLTFTTDVMHELESEEEADAINAEIAAYALKPLNVKFEEGGLSALIG